MPEEEKMECLRAFEEVTYKEYIENQGKPLKKDVALYYKKIYEDTSKKLKDLSKGKIQNSLICEKNEIKDFEEYELICERIGITDFEENDIINNRVQKKVSIYKKLPSQIKLQTILEESQDILELFEKAEKVQSQNLSESPVHGVQHVKNVLLISNYLGKKNNISEQDIDILREAAIYHDICHKRSGNKEHAKEGADYYLQGVESKLKQNEKEEVAFLIEAHEIDGLEKIILNANRRFPNISDERKRELIVLVQILQDADRLDMLRYDIEKAYRQIFEPSKLNDSANAKLISAVIELNTRQALKTGYLRMEKINTGNMSENLLRLYLDKKTTYQEVNATREMVASKPEEVIDQSVKEN